MKVLFFSIKNFEHPYLLEGNKYGFEISMVEQPLNLSSVSLAKGFDVVSIFTGDDGSSAVLAALKDVGVKAIVLRSASFDNLDIEAALKKGFNVYHVQEYCPFAIAEHAISILLQVYRQIMTRQEQFHMQHFSVADQRGFDLDKKTIGVIGTGKVGTIIAKMMLGFGCNVLAYDWEENEELESYDVSYVPLEDVCQQSDIISINTPTVAGARHLVTAAMIGKMKKGVIVINTAKGNTVKTEDVIHFLENGQIGYYGMDVYEKEKGVFFFDHTGHDIHDPLLVKLLKFPNVYVNPHHGFATVEALKNIAAATYYSIHCFQNKIGCANELTVAETFLRTIPASSMDYARTI